MRRATERRCRCERFMRLSAAHDLPGGQSAESGGDDEPEGWNRMAGGTRGGFREPERHWRCQRVLEAETTCERLASETRSRSVVRVDEAESRGGQPKWLSAATWPRNRSPHQTERSKARVLAAGWRPRRKG